MKSRPLLQLLSLALAGGVSATPSEGGSSRPLRLEPPITFPHQPLYLRPALGQSPPYNQRKARKARRVRHGAGDRFAFTR